jgi:hypothetical protein
VKLADAHETMPAGSGASAGSLGRPESPGCSISLRFLAAGAGCRVNDEAREDGTGLRAGHDEAVRPAAVGKIRLRASARATAAKRSHRRPDLAEEHDAPGTIGE